MYTFTHFVSYLLTNSTIYNINQVTPGHIFISYNFLFVCCITDKWSHSYTKNNVFVFPQSASLPFFSPLRVLSFIASCAGVHIELRWWATGAQRTRPGWSSNQSGLCSAPGRGTRSPGGGTWRWDRQQSLSDLRRSGRAQWSRRDLQCTCRKAVLRRAGRRWRRRPRRGPTMSGRTQTSLG